MIQRNYVTSCDAVIHQVGDQAGSVASEANRQGILERHSYQKLEDELGLNRQQVDGLTYTQWEAWLAVLHQRKLYICTPTYAAQRDSQIVDVAEAESQRKRQQEHLDLLRQNGRYAENPLKFPGPLELAIALLRSLQSLLPPVNVPISPTLPPSIRHLLKGREGWLARLREALRRDAVGPIDAQRVAIWGTGGIGKTRLAIDYAHAFWPRASCLVGRQRALARGFEIWNYLRPSPARRSWNESRRRNAEYPNKWPIGLKPRIYLALFK